MNSFKLPARFHRGLNDEDERHDLDHADGGDALHRIVRQFVQCRSRSITRRHHGDRVAVRGRTRGDFRPDRAARAGAIVDHE